MRSIYAFAIAAAALFGAIAATVAVNAGCGNSDPTARGLMPIRYQAPSDGNMSGAVLIRTGVAFAQSRGEPNASTPGRSFWCSLTPTEIGLLGFALFLVLTAGFQGFWMWRALHATEKSARTVDDALKSTQRAYVVFEKFEVSVGRSPLDEITSCTLQPVWQNAGTTPTRHGRAHVNWRYFERSIPNDFDFADFDEMGNRVLAYDSYLPLVLGPKAQSFSPLMAIDTATLGMVRDLKGRVLIWGWAEYDDVFAEGRHRTEFCYQMTITGAGAAGRVGFVQYRRFNGVDEECERKPTALTRQ